jgi:predicted phosphodiesterase
MTDIHLNFLPLEEVISFMNVLARHPAQAFLISGDLTDGPNLKLTLAMFHELVGKPIYFVCGNHDYYHGSIQQTRAEMADYLPDWPNLRWLNQHSVVELSPTQGLIGHDGWADGGYGDFLNSPIILNDYLLIEELRQGNSRQRLHTLGQLGAESAAHIRQHLPLALARYEQVFVLTHVPPFAEAAIRRKQAHPELALPHFSNHALGQALLEVAEAHPQQRIIVLCGHTHEARDLLIRPNLRVIVGQAEYHHPGLQPFMVTLD